MMNHERLITKGQVAKRIAKKTFVVGTNSCLWQITS